MHSDKGARVDSAEGAAWARRCALARHNCQRRLLMEEIDDSIVCRWFVGLGMGDATRAPTTFSKKSDLLLKGYCGPLDAAVDQACQTGLLTTSVSPSTALRWKHRAP